MSSLKNAVDVLIYKDDNYADYDLIDDTRVFYNRYSRNEFGEIKNCQYLILYKPTNKVYTSLPYAYTQSDEKEIEEYLNKPNNSTYKKSKVIQFLNTIN